MNPNGLSAENARHTHQKRERAFIIIKTEIKKALENASEQFEKAKPSLREGLNSAWNACESGAEKAVESAKNACERAVDSLRSARDDLAPDPAKAKKDGADEALDLDVEETLAKIRSAKTESNIISDYISRKYGNNDN